MSESEQGGAGRREVAYRIFAAEYDDADFSYSESDEERAPNYVVTPSGARINRLFVVGVLTETEQVNEEVLRARVVDPTGAFVVYAGQYQPDELAFLERADPPAFVAVTGKARTFQPDDSETVYTSVRPESINEVDAETRDRWVVQTAEQTLHRVATMADALGREERGDDLQAALTAAGVDEGLAAGVAIALEHYGTTPTYLGALRETALDAARVVAGERDEVDSFTTAPDEEGATTLGDLAAMDSPFGDFDAAEAGETAPDSTATPGVTTGDETSTGTATEATTAAQDAAEDESTTQATSDGNTTSSEDTTTSDETTVVSHDAAAEPGVAESTDPSVETEPQSAEPAGASDAESAANSTDEGAGETESEPAEDDIGDFDGGEFELEEDERERIEDEYGTDFSTGTEVEEPGEADIETPDPEDLEPEETAESAAEPAAEETEPEPAGAGETEPAAESEPEPAAESETETVTPESEVEPEPTTEGSETESAAEEPPTEETPAAEDVDLTDAVMDAMRGLDDGDGADREAVVERVVEEYGADPDEVEDAVQDALMDGRCYEPNETTLKPI